MMNRRDFISTSVWAGGCSLLLPLTTACARGETVEVLMQMLMPYIGMGHLQILLNHRIVSADTQSDEVCAVTVENRFNKDNVVLTVFP